MKPSGGSGYIPALARLQRSSQVKGRSRFAVVIAIPHSTAGEKSAPVVDAARKRARKRGHQLAETVRERGAELAETARERSGELAHRGRVKARRWR